MKGILVSSILILRLLSSFYHGNPPSMRWTTGHPSQRAAEMRFPRMPLSLFQFPLVLQLTSATNCCTVPLRMLGCFSTPSLSSPCLALPLALLPPCSCSEMDRNLVASCLHPVSLQQTPFTLLHASSLRCSLLRPSPALKTLLLFALPFSETLCKCTVFSSLCSTSSKIQCKYDFIGNIVFSRMEKINVLKGAGISSGDSFIMDYFKGCVYLLPMYFKCRSNFSTILCII